MTTIEVPMHRAREGKRTVFAASAPAPRSLPPRVPRVARMLAVGHALRAALDGTANLSELASATGFTPERITQLVDLTFLAPDIQERLVFDDLPVTAKALQPITLMRSWAEQRLAFERTLASRRRRLLRYSRGAAPGPAHANSADALIVERRIVG